MENKAIANVKETEERMPILKCWSIRFIDSEDVPRADQREIFDRLAETFRNETAGTMNEIHSKCAIRLYGNVYGRDGFPDGSAIRTSQICRIEKIDDDLWFATNRKGSGYYIRPSEAAIETAVKLYLKPVIKNWKFDFDEESVEKVRGELSAQELKDRVVFAFFRNFTKGAVCPPMTTFVSGSVYGDEECEWGGQIRTTAIKQIAILKWQPDEHLWFCGNYSLDEIDDFSNKIIYEVTLEDDRKYYILNDEEDMKMILDNRVYARFNGVEDILYPKKD